MKVRDLNGEVRDWKLHGNIVRSNDLRPRSQLHLSARNLLREIFPTVQLMEEVPVPITRTEKLFFDFYINTLKLVVEPHGEQHYKFNSLFHTSAQDFVNQRKRDSRKREWCEYNNITYVELPFNEGVKQWKKRILQSNN